jgi:hypothetical protein
MKAGTTGLLTKAATTRVVCPIQAGRQHRFPDELYKGSQTRTLCSLTVHPVRGLKAARPAWAASQQSRVSIIY